VHENRNVAPKESGVTKDEILTFLKGKKKELSEIFGITAIGIFGSYSRGDHNENSDVDIVYLLKDKNKFGYFQYLDLEEMLSKQFKKKVELVNYKYMNPIIKKKAEKEIIYA
jgi:predicted nucleotidyltransferase